MPRKFYSSPRVRVLTDAACPTTCRPPCQRFFCALPRGPLLRACAALLPATRISGFCYYCFQLVSLLTGSWHYKHLRVPSFALVRLRWFGAFCMPPRRASARALFAAATAPVLLFFLARTARAVLNNARCVCLLHLQTQPPSRHAGLWYLVSAAPPHCAYLRRRQFTCWFNA